MIRSADSAVNYQERASEFAVGDIVVPYGHSSEVAGRVVAVWSAIGMVDVEFTSGNKRYAVEDLQIMTDVDSIPPRTDTFPGGLPTVSVPGGPVPQMPKEGSLENPLERGKGPAGDPERVARAFVKKAIYWGARDRKYRVTQRERDSGRFYCPKCRDVPLRKAIYKRRDGASERLLGCPGCLFLIKEVDVTINMVEAS